MRHLARVFKRDSRQKTCWSLSTDREQMNVWHLEKQILKQVWRQCAPHIIVF